MFYLFFNILFSICIGDTSSYFSDSSTLLSPSPLVSSLNFNNSGGPGLSFPEYSQKYPGLSSHSVNTADAAISSRTSSSRSCSSSSTVVNNSLHNSMNNSSTRKTTLCSNSTSNQRVFESISGSTMSTPTSKQVDLLQHGNRNLRHIDSSMSTTEAADS